MKKSQLQEIVREVILENEIEAALKQTFNQIGKELSEILETEDVAVIIDAKHLCVSSRGIKDESSSTVTAFYGGAFKNPQKLNELHNYINQ